MFQKSVFSFFFNKSICSNTPLSFPRHPQTLLSSKNVHTQFQKAPWYVWLSIFMADASDFSGLYCQCISLTKNSRVNSSLFLIYIVIRSHFSRFWNRTRNIIEITNLHGVLRKTGKIMQRLGVFSLLRNSPHLGQHVPEQNLMMQIHRGQIVPERGGRKRNRVHPTCQGPWFKSLEED
jgi:hypothetical protein